ncbi:MAG: MnmC family methyltransferase, partial [Bacteroidetes bacterium]|nr:MnmC family methyltransferase [Bacteroidota bacterium]
HPHFNFHKQKIDFLNFSSQAQFDILYYDAFGYHAQSDLWQTDALQKSYDLLRPGGVWVSYCAKGTVRRSLQQVGFQVERLEGPPGKREMLRAIKML